LASRFGSHRSGSFSYQQEFVGSELTIRTRLVVALDKVGAVASAV
jgi:hypothetical protein